MLKRTLFVLFSLLIVLMLFSLPIMANNRTAESSVNSDNMQAPVVNVDILDETVSSRESNSDTTSPEETIMNEVEVNDNDITLDSEIVENRDSMSQTEDIPDPDNNNPDESVDNSDNSKYNDLSDGTRMDQTEPEKTESSMFDANSYNYENFPTNIEVVEIVDGYRLKMSVQNNSGQDILLDQSTIFSRFFAYDVQNENWLYLREKNWDIDPKLFPAGQTFTEEFDLTIQTLSQFTGNPQGEYMFWAVPSIVSNNFHTQLVTVYAKVAFPAES